MTSKNKSLRFFGISKVIPFLSKYRKQFTIMLVCGTLSCVPDIVIPLLQRYALNHYIANKTLDTLVYFVTFYASLVIGSAILNYFTCSRTIAVEVSINKDLRNAAFRHLQTQSLAYYNVNSVGYIHSRVMSDASKIGVLVSWNLMDFVWRGTILIGSIVVMFVINAKLAAMVVAIIPILAGAFAFFQKRLVKIIRQIRESNSMITSNFNEGITGAKTVKSLSIEKKMTDHFKSETSGMVSKSKKEAMLNGLFESSLHMATSIAVAIVLWKGGAIAKTEIGTFSMFMSYAEGMLEHIRWLVQVISNLITTQINIERLFNLIETKPNVTDSDEVIEKYGDLFNPKKENWEELHGDIEFKDVSFKYPDGDELVFDGFNLKIDFGTNIAIVGETGAGKSTLVNLICRFFEPTKGQILIDGRDARERSQLWLQSNLGYVLQSPHLFSGSIKDNLKYGNENATDKELEEALKMVSADEVVARLENGIDSNVGEGGDSLSTGEKQLISFARAILANPKILILDEATASVDTVTEQKIQSAIDKIIKGRTSIIIAHRLSTVRNADLILVVRDGKIVEQGKHKDLLQKRGYYYTLHQKQYEKDAEETVYSK